MALFSQHWLIQSAIAKSWTMGFHPALADLDRKLALRNAATYAHVTLDEEKVRNWKDHDNTIDWFSQCIPTLAQGPVVMITHHAPSPQSFNNGYREESSKPFYVNDLESFINKNSNIKYWVHGHIHETNNYQIGECNVVSNPRGYYKYGTNEEFLMNKTILINS